MSGKAKQNDNKKKENIIVAICMVVILVLLFTIFGWTNIKKWLATPLFWKGQDKVTIYYIGTLPENHSDSKYTIHFSVANNTNEEIDEYEFIINIADIEYEYKYHSNYPIQKTGLTDISIYASVGTSSYSGIEISEETLNILKNSTPENAPNFSYKVKYLKSDGKTLVNNTGLWKDLLILLVSALCGFMAIGLEIKQMWLRIVLKVLSLPAIVIVIIGMAIFAILAGSAGSTGSQDAKEYAEKSFKKSAAEKYKREAGSKAGHLAHGNTREAAFAQARMDSAMADMLAGTSHQSERERIKRAAQQKAGAQARGNTREAANAQATIDREVANILSDK